VANRAYECFEAKGAGRVALKEFEGEYSSVAAVTVWLTGHIII
jgi:hypothetical protein